MQEPRHNEGNEQRVPAAEEMARHAGEAGRLLRALANEHRLMILCALCEGELSVGALNARLPLSQSALSQHLAVLRRDGLVTTRREAQTIHYGIVDGPALRVLDVLYELYCRPGDDRGRRAVSGGPEGGAS